MTEIWRVIQKEILKWTRCFLLLSHPYAEIGTLLLQVKICLRKGVVIVNGIWSLATRKQNYALARKLVLAVNRMVDGGPFDMNTTH